ncbi:MAG: hypothetical protein HY739_04875 [Desulfobacterales bacterium]|nr:hypothetical protein [Desulfobacterales bacterium]
MRRLAIVFAVLSVFSVSAHAQMGEGKMPMMPMCEQMMKQMMMDMMQMQKKMIMKKELKPAEKKEMMMDMNKMQKKMEKMMSMHMGMMGMDVQAKLKCAEEWLKKAIDLHEVHIKDPKTATESSQMEMMEQMKKAYECILGGNKIEAAPFKETEGKEPPKSEPQHKH